jgi:hypothetical protein
VQARLVAQFADLNTLRQALERKTIKEIEPLVMISCTLIICSDCLQKWVEGAQGKVYPFPSCCRPLMNIVDYLLSDSTNLL